jgi:hypothetical protein
MNKGDLINEVTKVVSIKSTQIYSGQSTERGR